MDVLYSLEDLKELVKNSGNNNPNIFIMSDMKTKEQTHEAFPPTNIFIDFEGDIIIQIDEHMLTQ